MAELDFLQIGQRIRNQREYLKYTREELAEKLDITPKFCADIELGARGMSLQTLCRISKVLNLSTDTILFGSPKTVEESPIVAMLSTCPEDKQKYAVEILKNFLLALD